MSIAKIDDSLFKRPKINLPGFLLLGEDLYDDPEGYYPAYGEGTDIRNMLESFLESVGKKMPEDGSLPNFLYYPEDDHKEIFSGVVEGSNVRKQWEDWLSKCPSK